MALAFTQIRRELLTMDNGGMTCSMDKVKKGGKIQVLLFQANFIKDLDRDMEFGFTKEENMRENGRII